MAGKWPVYFCTVDMLTGGANRVREIPRGSWRNAKRLRTVHLRRKTGGPEAKSHHGKGAHTLRRYLERDIRPRNI